MKGVFFKPWIGKNYLNNGGIIGIKMLVLGESHWCVDSKKSCVNCGSPNKCSLTNDASKRFIDYKNDKQKIETWMPTWTKFINVFYGKK